MWYKKRIWVLLLALNQISCNSQKDSTNEIVSLQDEDISHESQLSDKATLEARIQVPKNYTRTDVPPNSFQQYLRTLPLKSAESQVKYYNGSIKANNGIYTAVVDLEIGNKDLHQCADAVMRLKAEYLWKSGQYDQIHFNFTNGFRANFSEWMKGRRIQVNGNHVSWNNRVNPSNSYEDFWKYMEQVFMYAGTASLEKELDAVEISDMEIGDVLIQGGFPGHAVIVVDMAKNIETGEQIYLLAQSYMPAQEIQILINSMNQNLSPWYELNYENIIRTPEWTFSKSDLRRFPD